MHFTSLILAFSLASFASAATIAKRTFFYPTFFHLTGATEASDYLTYVLVPTVGGEALAPLF